MFLLKILDYNVCTLLLQFIFTIGLDQYPCCVEASRLRSKLIVEFNPYVSVLVTWDQNRYNMSELVPLVAKVATEFDRILIDVKGTFDEDSLHGKTFPPKLSTSSVLLSPLAVAKYNEHRKKSERKLEVWLAYSENYFDNVLIELSRNLKYVADQANDIHKGTVTTIVFADYHPNPTLNVSVMEIIRNKEIYNSVHLKRIYKWGVYLYQHGICDPKHAWKLEEIQKVKADMVLVDFEHSPVPTNLSSQCKEYRGNQSASNVVFWFRPSDTYKSGTINMSRLVDTWNSLQKFAAQSHSPVVVSKAFDTTCESIKTCRAFPPPVRLMTGGWWRLQENANYSSTADYIFQAKRDIAEDFDRMANSVNLTLLEEKGQQNWSINHLGIIFSTSFSPDINSLDGGMGQWHWNSLADDGIISAIIANYRKIVILLDQASNERDSDAEDELRYCTNLVPETTSIIVLVLPGVPLDAFPEVLANLASLSPSKRPTVVRSFDISKWQNIENTTTEQYYNLSSIGHAFPISDCANTDKLTKYQKQKMETVLRTSSMVLFLFEEDEEIVKLGTDRLFQQRMVIFAQCNNYINALKRLNSTAGNNVEYGFVLLHYDTPPNIYKDVVALYNFVLYWEKLKEWAVQTETTVIMSSALDSMRYLRGSKLRLKEFGWWKHQFKKYGQGSDSIHGWIDKKTELLAHPDLVNKTASAPKNDHLPRPDDNALSIKAIIMINMGIVAVVILCLSVTVFFVYRRYYQKRFLTNTELNGFFQGSQNSNELAGLYKQPYNKSLLELESKSFSIDHECVLGSGEFGMVCSGKVEKPNGDFVNVAVKMVNSAKFQKTALTGLLSEIKVLAHVGKHENIIELVGAYTEELRRGKIFVFLELGQCGSLEKYLRDLRPGQSKACGSSQGEDEIELAELTSNVGDSTVLDASLAQDLYRWSREICSGMSFLASKHVVHADLATRNVLLNGNKTAKICDFGLSRRMYNYASYVKQRQEPLPWKWLPPESLRLMEFNEKSDVWAYGVTLWEVYSLGDTPYPGLSWDSNFPRMLEQGFRMSEPQYNDRNMYSIMMKCWNTNPFARPSFADLVVLFNDSKVFD